MINWHPDENLLLEFSSGQLDTAHSLFVSAHLHYCRECRSVCDNLDILGATLLEGSTRKEVSGSLLESTLSVLDTMPPLEQPAIDHKRITCSKLPRAISKLIGGELESANWKWRWPGLKVADITERQNGQVSLYRISPGKKMPSHDHGGEEITLVLQGSFSDAYGTYRAGDVVTRMPNEEHTPIASQNEVCYCLVLESKRPIFRGFRGRLINKAQALFSGPPSHT